MKYSSSRNILAAENLAMVNAMTYHVTHKGKRLDFKNNPYLIRIYKDLHKNIVVKKSTQCGISEWLLVLVLAAAILGRGIFYVMPNYQLVRRFVMERFDKTMRMTPAYSAYLQGQEAQAAYSVTLKQIGLGTISFAGSMVPNAFTEFAADWFVVDELDRCNQANLEMGWERLSASLPENRREIKVSNPTITGFGIDAAFSESDKCQWHIKHDCGNYVRPNFFRHVIKDVDGQMVYADDEYDPASGRDCRMICDKCGRPIDRRGAGEWIPENPNAAIRGYHITKLFSANVKLRDLVRRYEAGENNPESMVRFYNGDLGEAYDAPGVRIARTDLDDLVENYPQGQASGPCFVGVDVGTVLHVIVGNLCSDGKVRLVLIKTIQGIEDLSDLGMEISRYDVRTGVIDERPEVRFARKLAYRYRRWFMCRYAAGKRDAIDLKAKVVSVDRTSALDAVKEAVNLKSIILPADALSIPDFVDHMTALTRVYDPDANGGEGAYGWAGTRADHYFHALGYMLVAKRLATMRR